MNWGVQSDLLPNPLMSNARARPDHVALISNGNALTFDDLKDRVSHRAGALRAQGLRASQIVFILAPRSLEALIDLLAVGWCDAVVAISSASLDAESLRSRQQSIECDWCLGDVADVSNLSPLLAGDGPAMPALAWSLKSPRFVLWTSGSSGRAKPIEISVGQWVFSAMASAIRLEHHHSDVWLACLPLEHIGGLSVILRTLLYGTTSVLHFAFNAEAVADAMCAGLVSQVSLVPSMLRQILDLNRPKLTSDRLRLVLLGGAAASLSLRADAQAADLPVFLSWGMTETASQVCTVRDEPGLEPGVVGASLAFCEVSESDGQFVVSGPIANHGHHETGDFGSMNSKGEQLIAGRVDQVIKSGGEKVALRAITEALSAFAEVTEVMVIAREDPRWGQRPVVFLVSTLDPEALMVQLDVRFSTFAVPRSWVFVHSLPRTKAEKIDGEALRIALACLKGETDGFKARGRFIDRPIRFEVESCQRLDLKTTKQSLGQEERDLERNLYDG